MRKAGPRVRIAAAAPAQLADWARMRHSLWPEESAKDLAGEAAEFFAGRVRHLRAVLLALDAYGSSIGFAEMNIRPYAEGCTSDNVAFLEGWFVELRHRRQGIGAALVRACEDWARTQGCTEFASDALAHNRASRSAHKALGFEEVEVIRCFRKPLRGRGKQKR